MMTVHCYLFVYQQGCQIMLFRNSYVTENKHRDKHNDISESLSHHLKHLFPHCKLMLLNKCVDCHFLNIRGRKVFCDAWKSETYTIVSVDMLLKYHYFRTSQYSQVHFYCMRSNSHCLPPRVIKVTCEEQKEGPI